MFRPWTTKIHWGGFSKFLNSLTTNVCRTTRDLRWLPFTWKDQLSVGTNGCHVTDSLLHGWPNYRPWNHVSPRLTTTTPHRAFKWNDLRRFSHQPHVTPPPLSLPQITPTNKISPAISTPRDPIKRLSPVYFF